MKYGTKAFNNIGAINTVFDETDMAPIKAEIDAIKDKWTAEPWNNKLAGNIEHEYALTACHGHVESLLLPLVHDYDLHFNYYENFTSVISDIKGIKLGSLWVNFQKKYEFNPWHYHDGLMSFVIWVDTPFDIKDEMNHKSSKNSNANVPGHFSLAYINALGQIRTENLPVDRSWNGRCLMFPSSMYHCVYPFYTSDEYRISVSGNFMLKN